MTEFKTDPPMMAVRCWVPTCNRLKKWVPGPAGSISHGACRYHFLCALEDGDDLTLLEALELFYRRNWWWLLPLVAAAVAL